MTVRQKQFRRDYGVTAGVPAAMLSATTLVIGIGREEAFATSVIGSAGAVAVLTAALVASLVGTAACMARTGLLVRSRIPLAAATCVVAVAVTVVAVPGLLTPRHFPDRVLGILVQAAAVALFALVVKIVVIARAHPIVPKDL